MVYVKSNSSTTAWGRLKYIFDEPAHDGSKHRVLDVTGDNIRLWGLRDRAYSEQSAYYLNQQFKTVRQHAWNKHKRHQAQHMILSFAEDEFDTNNPDTLTDKAKQVNHLVKGFMDEHFPGSQWVSAVQCDGDGHRIHAHVLINTIDLAGKCIRTNDFKVYRLRNQWNKYLDANYLSVTDHAYINPYSKLKPGTKVKSVNGWQAQLQQTLEWARQTAYSIEQYLGLLKEKNVTVTKRNKRKDWSYHVTVNNKKKTVRDFYQRIDRQTGLVKSTRGMGLAYTPSSLSSYFKEKNKKENQNDEKEESEPTNGRLKQLARDAERQQERRFIDQIIIERDDEQHDGTSDQTGYPESSDGSDEEHSGSTGEDGCQF